MRPVVLQQRRLDGWAQEHWGIPGEVWMQGAGDRVGALIAQLCPKAQTFWVACGPGCNGGDGFVVARWLADWRPDATVVVLLAQPLETMMGETAVHATWLARRTHQLPHLSFMYWDACREALGAGTQASPDVVVEALFSLGLNRPLTEQYEELITWLNQVGSSANACRIAIDVPAGIQGDEAQVLGDTVFHATHTIAINSLAPCHVLPPTHCQMGTLWHLPLGIPVEDIPVEDIPALAEAPPAVGRVAWVPEPRDLQTRLAPPPPLTNKYRRGVVTVVGGCDAFPGAPRLAAAAAQRAGAGLVQCLTPGGGPLPESLVGADWHRLGAAPGSHWGPSHTQALVAGWQDGNARLPDVLLVGPGLGRHPETGEAFNTLLDAWQTLAADRPLVVDGDGLYWVAQRRQQQPDWSPEGDWCLTPHEGEAARLREAVGMPPALGEGPTLLQSVLALVSAYQATVVAKGPVVVTGTPQGECVINPTGTPWLAVAGTGDVLAGLVAALMLVHEDAAWMAAALHGATASWLAQQQHGLLAENLITALPHVLHRLAQPHPLPQDGHAFRRVSWPVE